VYPTCPRRSSGTPDLFRADDCRATVAGDDRAGRDVRAGEATGGARSRAEGRGGAVADRSRRARRRPERRGRISDDDHARGDTGITSCQATPRGTCRLRMLARQADAERDATQPARPGAGRNGGNAQQEKEVFEDMIRPHPT